MSTPLKKVVDDQVGASGMAAELLDADDAEYVTAGVKSVLSSLLARRAWENHVGPIFTHKQTLEATGWSKQCLSQAVKENRVLHLYEADGTTSGYWSGGRTLRTALVAGEVSDVAVLARRTADGGTALGVSAPSTTQHLSSAGGSAVVCGRRVRFRCKPSPFVPVLSGSTNGAS